MIVIVKKDGEYVNRIVAESLEVAQQIYGEDHTVEEEVIIEPVYEPAPDMTGKKYCPVCHKAIPDSAEICPECGATF